MALHTGPGWADAPPSVRKGVSEKAGEDGIRAHRNKEAYNIRSTEAVHIEVEKRIALGGWLDFGVARRGGLAFGWTRLSSTNTLRGCWRGANRLGGGIIWCGLLYFGFPPSRR